ncbi:MAG: SMC family ATPase, partial [Microbispora sp.]|nr:SMC family ATPase [Microbispora sp.]
MRLHRLRLVAFGSFPGTEEVDFDTLGDAGLFLIHGPTGAGKTTVLDAVCYALYGKVPGQRDSARSLRCDHAPPDRGPSVTLEVTIRGRRLRITRSPAWMRPKLRGSGLVEEKAKARVEELVEPGGQWVVRSTRSDEAGDFVNTLTGMTAAQFCQVAMLPQGEFAKFLRAGGEERRELLERLFSVRVFGDVERWLADHRTRTWREAQELGQRVESVIDRMRGAAGDDLPLPGDTGEPEAWSREVLGLARGALADAVAAHSASQEALLSARARLEEGRALADRQRRYAAALARRRELDAAADERSDLEAMLDEAARADRVAPLIRQAGQRAESAAKARRVAADAVLRALPGPAASRPHARTSAGPVAGREAGSADATGWDAARHGAGDTARYGSG